MVLSNDSERVEISETFRLQSSSVSQLTLSPLSAEDENITCSATAYLPSSSPYSIENSTGSDNVELSIIGIYYLLQ